MTQWHMRVLVVGWFSFEHQGATAGDLMSRDTVAKWLSDADIPHDVVNAHPFQGGVAWEDVLPHHYSDVVFVCGPFGNGHPITDLLSRFRHCRLHGINVTMLQSLDEWNPFTMLFERDSSRASRPDLVFLSDAPRVAVVGLVLVHTQREYGDRSRHRDVEATVLSVLTRSGAAVVPIDTRLDDNATGLSTAAHVESLIARMDLVITTRLHGTVLALKNGVPVVPIDAISGGAKVTSQVRAIGWPILLTVDDLSEVALNRAIEDCLGHTLRAQATECAARAQATLGSLESHVIEALRRGR